MNIEHRTSNIEHPMTCDRASLKHSMLGVRCSMFDVFPPLKQQLTNH